MLVYPIDKDLVLRLPREEYLEEAFATVKDNTDHLRPWLPWVTDEFSIDDARAFVRNNLQNFAENKGFALHIVSRGRIVGNVGYNTIDWANRRCEMGYCSSAMRRGKDS
jgi:ribosomal-protein-serine acetyltransferase